jgi:hypothetical protein
MAFGRVGQAATTVCRSLSAGACSDAAGEVLAAPWIQPAVAVAYE